MEKLVPAFTDDVDGSQNLANTGTYATGICGEKEVTLDAGTPAFLTLIPDSTNPVLNDFKIRYDEASAADSDVKTHTIHYTVTNKEYGTDIVSISGTFEI